jgi:hypothetical protein
MFHQEIAHIAHDGHEQEGGVLEPAAAAVVRLELTT